MLFIFGGLMLALAILNSPAGAAVFAPEVVAWWRFEPDDWLANSAGAASGLTNSGAALSTDVAPGAGSGSAYFNGSALMQTTGALDLTPYNHVALSWWQKAPTTATTIIWEHSADYNSNEGGLIGVLNHDSSNTVTGTGYVGLRRTSGGPGYNIETFPHPTDITWQHFTAQLNLGLPAASTRERMKIFRNGVLVSSDQRSEGLPTSLLNDTFFLGARSGGVLPLQGWLDEVKIETVSSYVNDVANHPNLVGYWRLGESAGPTAWEVKGTVGNGTYVNTTAGDFSQPGAVNFDLDTAVLFNGTSSYVDADNHASLNGDWDGLTVAAWVKPESDALTGAKIIAGKWQGSASQDHFALFLLDGRPGIAVADGINGEDGLFGATALQPDEWYFLAGSWDEASGAYKLYINGELDPTVGTQSGDGINIGSTTTMKIGAQAGAGTQGRYFSGLIDEVAVFSTVLSQAELMAHYRTAMVPEPSGVLMALVGLLCLLGRRRRR